MLMRGMHRRRSEFWTRAPLIALVAAAAMLVAGLILAVHNEQGYRAQKVDEVTVSGRFLALIVSAALDFHDRQAAQEYVDALKANPEIVAAAVYDAQGTLFVSYARARAHPIPAAPPAPGSAYKSNRLIVVLPVEQDGPQLGTVYLDVETEPFARRMQRYVGIGLLVMLSALLVAVLGAAQWALRKANEELERRAVELAATNRELEAQIEEREKAEEALRQSQKMEAIGRLTGGVAHDFNNLLTVVAGNLDLIRRMAMRATDNVVPTGRLLRLVEATQAGLSRGERMIRQLLTFSRRDPLDEAVVEINATLTDFAPLVQRAIGETVALQLRLGEGRWFCSLDPGQFEAAILNLAVNARDACGDGGVLTIATGLAAATEGGPPQVAIAVSDTGCGMPPEVQRQIFEPFYTTKPHGQGSGLGLAQVWGFVTQSRGRIGVESEPGKGTTFRLFLPLAAPAAETRPAETGVAAEPHGSETVLVVEDQDDVREVASATLESLGYRTVTARDGPEALAILRARRDIDLLFSDFVMPNGMNGAELAREALRLRPELKVLLTSGYAQQRGSGRANSPVEGFPMIDKPYRSADLAVRLRDILDRIPAERAG